MSLQQQDPPPLFASAKTSTSQRAGQVAARSIGHRHQQIIDAIRDHGPMTIFEIAARLDVFDHQISGRFSELAAQGLIEPSGLERPKPSTGCAATVWRLRQFDMGQEASE